jgi:hypothetical protein
MAHPIVRFELPPAIRELVGVRNRLREHYKEAHLKFTLDGNLVGDIGEAIARELFGIRLSDRNGTGVDGHAPDGRSVQVKASGSQRGPAFRIVDRRADHLIFFSLDFEACRGVVDFNGPERIALQFLPPTWTKNQRSLSLSQIKRANLLVPPDARLELMPIATSAA